MTKMTQLQRTLETTIFLQYYGIFEAIGQTSIASTKSCKHAANYLDECCLRSVDMTWDFLG